MSDGTIDLGGAFLPVTTPFDAVSGDVDLSAFRANLDRWFENPVSGILIAGSTGTHTITFEQLQNDTYKWGVTNVQLTSAPVGETLPELVVNGPTDTHD